MYEVIVVGAGHAGCEAALATARLGHNTLLITTNINNVADMPCNPSIGGSAKGIVVREIDALGGEMGINADKSHLQIKMLNIKKGPGVRALRCQADKTIYPENMLKVLKSTKNLTILEDLVEKIIVEKEEIRGVITKIKGKIYSKIVILTTGTYLNAVVMRGHRKKEAGPHGEIAATNLSKSLEQNGIKLIRLKTGTPPRVLKSSINFDAMIEEKGDNELLSFSNFYKPKYKIENQIPCHLTYTNEKTHNLILKNLDKCALYSGMITGVGPRYCPSIEDKVVKFKDKNRHQIFIEPERLNGIEMYVGGFSTTMPKKIQEKMVHTMIGLEKAIITKYGYAIEYDAVDPMTLSLSLESKIIKKLYTAGQINGTSGYEEAAAQGLIAGINASLNLNNKPPLILKRNEAYIGVLIDDLINKGITEPYRLLTSRAEYRLLLRHDNAILRLTEKGREVGLIDDKKYSIYLKKKESIQKLKDFIKQTKLIPTEINNKLIKFNLSPITSKISIEEYLRRPETKIEDIVNIFNINIDKEVCTIVETEIKYYGYIDKLNKEVEKMLKMENKQIPENINYDKIKNIATEARQKLSKIKPQTIGQATRISGVNPSDISMILIYLKKEYPHE